MTRIELDGEGQPIPVHALPAFGTSDDLAPTTLVFTEDTNFPVSAYRDLGFTHFEVWTVGAAGGHGSHGALQFVAAVLQEAKQVSSYAWDLIREYFRYEDYWGQKEDLASRPDLHKYGSALIDRVYSPGEPQGDPGSTGWKTDPGPYGPPTDHGGPMSFRWMHVIGHSTSHGVENQVNDGPTNWRYTTPRGNTKLMRYKWVDLAPAGGSGYGWWPADAHRNLLATALQMFDLAEALKSAAKQRIDTFHTITQTVLLPSVGAGRVGGSGGGGGLHKTSGALADLPDVVPIGVGQAGADGPWAQVKALGEYVPGIAELMTYWIQDVPAGDSGEAYYRRRQAEIHNYMEQYLKTYPLPHPGFGNPVGGSDGGPSYFGDVGMASGGKGGSPGMVWNPETSKFESQGWGGDGGIGGRLEAGGGGVGSKIQGANGGDGTWSPITGIGKGGGGGKAGLPSVTEGGGYPSSPWFPNTGSGTTTHYPPSAGGRGSYSSIDVDVHGPRGSRHQITYLKPVASPDKGTIVYTPETEAGTGSAPGAGGGARPRSDLKVGSRAAGYSPKGVVVIRLVKI